MCVRVCVCVCVCVCARARVCVCVRAITYGMLYVHNWCYLMSASSVGSAGMQEEITHLILNTSLDAVRAVENGVATVAYMFSYVRTCASGVTVTVI